MTRKVARYGWKPDLPDHRDHLYSVVVQPTELPVSVDLRPMCSSPVYDQGQIGSCTANAIAGAIEFDLIKQKLDVFKPSRLFIYYNERSMEGDTGQDNGAQIRDGISSVNSQGVCPEWMWPYDEAQFTTEPSAACYAEALKNKAVSYQRLNQNITVMKSCLASGYPFVFGFSVYDGFESEAVAQTGLLNLPGRKEKQLGGHAVMAAGYNDNTSRVLVRNSWGTKWGMAGYFTIPYSYISDSNLADDFWTIKVVS